MEQSCGGWNIIIIITLLQNIPVQNNGLLVLDFTRRPSFYV